LMLSRLPPVSNSHDQDDDRENDDWPHKYDKIGRHSRRFRCGCGSWDARRFEDGPPAEEHGWETHHYIGYETDRQFGRETHAPPFPHQELALPSS